MCCSLSSPEKGHLDRSEGSVSSERIRGHLSTPSSAYRFEKKNNTTIPASCATSVRFADASRYCLTEGQALIRCHAKPQVNGEVGRFCSVQLDDHLCDLIPDGTGF
ncbi:hypothetical protein HNY73_003852 [Argiope bruennichi]|uniref:Uncharacterized protein n=1 Tax=Argiope bruennichi TaxID=94029 RepID=A0A8T0FLZ5_ARGBR|nr:hypothetical protein HNY73_003852 [Argiope bruennichi]